MLIHGRIGSLAAAVFLFALATLSPQQTIGAPSTMRLRSVTYPDRVYAQALLQHQETQQPYIGTVRSLNGFFLGLQAIAYDDAKRRIFVAYGQFGETTIAKVNPNGVATVLSQITGFVDGIAYDPVTDRVYVGDGCQVLSVAALTGLTSLLAGGSCGTADGKGAAAQFQHAAGLAVDPSGKFLYVTDDDRVRQVTIRGNVTTITAPGSIGGGGGSCVFNQGFQGITYDLADGNLYVADSCPNLIRQVIIATGQVPTVAGSCIPDTFGNCQPLDRDGIGARSLFASPSAITYSPVDHALYVADASNNQIRRISASFHVTTLAGDGHPEFRNGVGQFAGFDEPNGIAARSDGLLYVADTLNQSIRSVTTQGVPPPPPSHGIALMDPPDLGAHPFGLAFTSDGSLWYSEFDAGKLVRVDTTGKAHSIPLPGSNFPTDVVADAAGDVWFADENGFPPYFFTMNIGVVRPNHGISFYTVPNGAQITSMTLGPDGNVWFAMPSVSALGSVDNTGAFVEYAVDEANYVSAGLSNDVWTTGGLYSAPSAYVERFSTAGTLLKRYVIQTYPPPIMGPIAPGPRGRMWFAESEAVGEVTHTTLAVFDLPPAPPPSQNGSWNPNGIVEGSDGALWFTAGAVGDLARINDLGDFTVYEVPTARSSPNRIVRAPDGTLWFTDYGAAKIGRWF